ncbi:MAG: type 4a pilus biogenesis protein PilO [Candidatus Falkowbacteria bacterium]
MKLLSVFKTMNLKKKIIANMILLIFVICGLIFYLIIPSINNIKEMGAEIDRLINDLEDKYYKGQSIEKLDENLKKIEPDLEKLNKILVSETTEIEFITKLEEIASKNNISQQINFKKVDEKNREKIPIQLTAQGDFSDQIRYLEDLERADYYINISSLELSYSSSVIRSPGKQDNEAQKKNINMIIFADVY